MLFLILLSINALAYENTNGDYWNSLDEESKEVYLRGLQDGLNSFLVMAKIHDGVNKFNTFEDLINELNENDDLFEFNNKNLNEANNYFKENKNKTIIKFFAKDSFESEKKTKTNSKDYNKLVQYDGMQAELDTFETLNPYGTGSIGIFFSNNHSKKLTGLEYQLILYDAFGDVIFNGEREIDFLIEANSSDYDLFDFLEINNPKLYALIKNDTLKGEVKILRAVFEDGKIIEY